MASGKDSNSSERFPDIDHRFRDMRDMMNRDREAFFNDSGSSATPTSSFFGRESPFFRVSLSSLLIHQSVYHKRSAHADECPTMISLLHLCVGAKI